MESLWSPREQFFIVMKQRLPDRQFDREPRHPTATNAGQVT